MVIQCSAKHEQKLDCGGVYIKLLSGDIDQKTFGGEDYKDNQIRFTLLRLAALGAPCILNPNSNKSFFGHYGKDVVFVYNDWHCWSSLMLPEEQAPRDVAV